MTEDVLPEARLQQIVSEERLRAQISESLAPKDKKRLSENVKWALVTIAIPLTTYVMGQWQERVAKAEARSREIIATQDRDLERVLADARNNVAAMTALLPALSDPDPKRSALALIVLKQLQNAQHTTDTRLDELAKAVQARIDQLRNSGDQDLQKQAAQQQETLSAASGTAPARTLAPQPASATAPAAVQQAVETKPRIVYIQFYDEAQRAPAAAVQQLLRAAGVGAPGIEKIAVARGARLGRRPAQIIYFNEDDLGGAKWLQQRLRAEAMGEWAIARSTITGVPAGQIELWWPNAT